MRALVTGSAGFIGIHVCRELISRGIEVTGFDQRTAGTEGVDEQTGDLLDPDRLAEVASNHDVICHIGAIGDVYLAAERPALAASVNVTGSSNVATAASQTGARVVYASTWEVYGEPQYEPVDEDHPCEPDHPYNITKLAGESMLLAAGRLQGVPVVALRLGTAFGLGMRPNSVFEIFIRKAKSGEPLTIQGDGAQGRQFTHARDIARAFALASISDLQGIALNIVSPEVVTIKHLAEQVAERYDAEISFGDARPGDVASSYVSSAKAADLLGWQSGIAFDEGLNELFEAHGK